MGDLFAVVVLTVNITYVLIVKWENPRFFYWCSILQIYWQEGVDVTFFINLSKQNRLKSAIPIGADLWGIEPI